MECPVAFQHHRRECPACWCRCRRRACCCCQREDRWEAPLVDRTYQALGSCWCEKPKVPVVRWPWVAGRPSRAVGRWFTILRLTVGKRSGERETRKKELVSFCCTSLAPLWRGLGEAQPYGSPQNKTSHLQLLAAGPGRWNCRIPCERNWPFIPERTSCVNPQTLRSASHHWSQL